MWFLYLLVFVCSDPPSKMNEKMVCVIYKKIFCGQFVYGQCMSSVNCCLEF